MLGGDTSEHFLRYYMKGTLGDIIAPRETLHSLRRVEKWPIRPVLWTVEFFMMRTIFNYPVHFYPPFHRPPTRTINLLLTASMKFRVAAI